MSMFDFPEATQDVEDGPDMSSVTPQLADSQVMTRKELINSRARIRNAVNRDAREAAERARSTASMMLSYSENSDWYAQRRSRHNKYESVAYGVSNMANKVLQSLDINVPLRVDADPRGRSYGITDYESIDITINIPESDIDNINNAEMLSDLVFKSKGMVYHEGGHIMWTYPFDSLTREVMATLGGDKYRGLLDSIIGEYVRKYAPELVDDYAGVLPTVVHGDSFIKRFLFPAWGVLEDQRMETAMCYTSPIMSRYFTEIVLDSVIDPQNPGTAWPWIAGRTYLSSNIRQVIRDLAETNKYSAIIDDINEQVFKYRKSNDVLEMFECIVRMSELMYLWYKGAPEGIKSPNNDHNRGESGEGAAKQLPIVPNPYEHDMETPNKTSGPQSKEDGQSDEEGNGDPQSDRPENTGDLASQYGKHAEEERSKNSEATRKEEIESVASDINKHRASDIKPFVNPRKMSSEEVDKSKSVANGMISVLESLHSQVDPSWRFYQDHGVLDPVAFSMAEPGDDRYWSGLDDMGANGHNLAISVLLDVSGSMSGHGHELSVAAMGIRKACEHFSIPCTITTFSDDARMFVEGDTEEAEFMNITIGGGTNVYQAISKMPDQTYGKHNHLVVILTDGEWSDIRDIRPWADNNKYIILVGFRMHDESIRSMRRKGANEVVNITQLSKLPQLLTQALAGFMAK